MKYKLSFLVLFFVALSIRQSYAQQITKQDTVLYLIFDQKKGYKNDAKAVDSEILKERWEYQYSFPNSHLYDRHPLQFISKNKCLDKKIRLKDLSEYPTVTLDELHSFIGQNYNTAFNRAQSSSYFNNLKKIFIVEIDDRQKLATITEVRLDITIE